MVESRIEEFLKLRRSEITQNEMRLAQSLLNPQEAEGKTIDQNTRDIFKIAKIEAEQFGKLSDLEQRRLYATLTDENNRLKESIKGYKKEYITVLESKGEAYGLNLADLLQENRRLRNEVKLITYQSDKVAVLLQEQTFQDRFFTQEKTTSQSLWKRSAESGSFKDGCLRRDKVK